MYSPIISPKLMNWFQFPPSLSAARGSPSPPPHLSQPLGPCRDSLCAYQLIFHQLDVPSLLLRFIRSHFPAPTHLLLLLLLVLPHQSLFRCESHGGVQKKNAQLNYPNESTDFGSRAQINTHNHILSGSANGQWTRLFVIVVGIIIGTT